MGPTFPKVKSGLGRPKAGCEVADMTKEKRDGGKQDEGKEKITPSVSRQ